MPDLNYKCINYCNLLLYSLKTDPSFQDICVFEFNVDFENQKELFQVAPHLPMVKKLLTYTPSGATAAEGATVASSSPTHLMLS